MSTTLRIPAAGSSIAADDTNPPVVGLEQEIVAIPCSRITGYTYDATYDNGLVTGITTTAAGLNISGRKSENVVQMGVEDLSEATSIQKYRHIVTGIRILNTSAETLDMLQDLLNGAERYTVVLQSRWKGTDKEDQYWIVGKDVGLVPRISAFNTGENDGVPLIDFMTPDGEHEPRLPMKVLDTDVATTAALFASGWA